MATKAQIRTNVLALLSNNDMIETTDVDALMVADHREILDSYTWSRRRADTTLTLVAPYSTGTITTSGTGVTGTGTTFTSTMIGRFLRGEDSNYFLRVSAFTSATAITLETALATALTDSDFTIFKHRYNLPSDFGRVVSVTSNFQAKAISRYDLDDIDPYRTTTASYPEYYIIFGLDPDTTSSQLFQMEVWPVPSSATILRVHYVKSNELSSDSDEPLYRSDILVWKSAESGAFFLHGKTGDAAWLALADRYHARYLEALQAAKEDDLGKSPVPFHIRDSQREGGPGDDFFLDHDNLRLR